MSSHQLYTMLAEVGSRGVLLLALVSALSCSVCATQYNYAVPYFNQLDYAGSPYYIGNSACAPTSIMMLLQYYFPSSNVDMPEVYHSGIQGYRYWGPAVGYKNVSFADPDPGLTIVDPVYRGYYNGSYSGLRSPDSAAQYLDLIWGGEGVAGEPDWDGVIAKIKERPFIMNVGTDSYGHYIVVRGYDDKGTASIYDDSFYINDPYPWPGQPSGNNRELSYSDLSGWYKGRVIMFDPSLSEAQRQYTVVVDAESVVLDDISDPDWWAYYGEYGGGGDWYYPNGAGHWAKWQPELLAAGRYDVHVVFHKDLNQSNVQYTVHDHTGTVLGSVSVNQAGSGWGDVSLGTYTLSNGAFAAVEDVPVSCNVDAVRFEFVGGLPPSLVSPLDDSHQSCGILFEWSSVPGASNYELAVQVPGSTSWASDTTTSTTYAFAPGEFGTYSWKVRAYTSGAWTDYSDTWVFHFNGVPAPALTYPEDYAQVTDPRPTFEWNSEPCANYYRLQLARDSAFADTVADELNIYDTSWESDTELDMGETYYWRVCSLNPIGNWSDVWQFDVVGTPPNDEPNEPTLTSPSNGATNQSLTPTLQASSFSDPNAGDTHANSQWQVDDSSSFTSPEWDSGQSYTAGTLTSVPSGNLSYSTQYYWRVRYKDNHGAWSNWSSYWHFTTEAEPNQPPNTPSLTSPSNGATNQSLTPTLQASSFSDPNAGDTHANSQWQVDNSSSFTSPEWDSGQSYVAGTSTSVPSGNLSYSTQYYWRVRYKDNHGAWSEWASYWYFTTDSGGTPDISATPSAIAQVMSPGEARGKSLQIQNMGDGDLAWSIELRNMQGPPATKTSPVTTGTPVLLAHPKGESKQQIPIASSVSDIEEGVAVSSKSSGGPDAAGYQWVDSHETGGPIYSWVDITTTETPIPMSDDSTLVGVPLAFPFPFYDETKSTIDIVSNGFLGFDGIDPSFSNAPIPDSEDPNGGLVCPFWDDLNPDSGGQIYYRSEADQFIVSWISVPHYPGSGSYTFQVILHPDGSIKYQYQSMGNGEVTNSATIGIENAEGSDGLQVAYNEDYVENGLAVLIAPPKTWIDVAPRSGTTPASGNASVTVTLDATGLSDGDVCTCDLLILSNDPDESEITIPIAMEVGSSTLPAFRVGSDGTVVADNAFYGSAFLSGSADVAEWVPVSEPVEPGDVLEFDPTTSTTYRLSKTPCSHLIAGVVSTAPGVVLGTEALLSDSGPRISDVGPACGVSDSGPASPDLGLWTMDRGLGASTSDSAPLALTGIVPVKVTDEGGAIEPGDLLVSSSTPGYAMRWAGPDPCPCALVGKALEPMTDDVGVILVLLTAH